MCICLLCKKSGSADIFAASGVDLDAVALVNEEGNTNLCAGFKSGGFGNVGSGIAFYAGFGGGDFKLDKVGSFKTENLALVREYATSCPLLRI